MDNKGITSKGFNELSKCVLNAGVENSLKELYVSHCNLSDDSIIAISQAIPCIERLNLSYNKGITSKGFNELSKCVLNAGVENSLKELNVSDCDLSDDSIIAISQAISCIERLDLSFNNGITSKGFNELSKCVLNAGVENSLKELNVRKIVTSVMIVL